MDFEHFLTTYIVDAVVLAVHQTLFTVIIVHPTLLTVVIKADYLYVLTVIIVVVACRRFITVIIVLVDCRRFITVIIVVPCLGVLTVVFAVVGLVVLL